MHLCVWQCCCCCCGVKGGKPKRLLASFNATADRGESTETLATTAVPSPGGGNVRVQWSHTYPGRSMSHSLHTHTQSLRVVWCGVVESVWFYIAWGVEIAFIMPPRQAHVQHNSDCAPKRRQQGRVSCFPHLTWDTHQVSYSPSTSNSESDWELFVKMLVFMK